MRGIQWSGICVLIFLAVFAGCSKEGKIESMTKEAQQLFQEKKYDEAIGLMEKSLGLVLSETGSHSPLAVDIYQQLAIYYGAKGDMLRAEAAYLNALACVNDIDGADSLEAVKIMNNLAGIYLAAKDYQRAVTYFSRALEAGKKVLPSYDPRLATLQANIEKCRKMAGQQKGSAAISGIEAGKGMEEPKNQHEDTKVAASGAEKSSSTESSAANIPSDIPDLVPASIKDFAIKNFEKANIIIRDLKPEPVIVINEQGVVFPYSCYSREGDNAKERRSLLVFAARRSPDNPNKYSFRESRLISYESYIEALNEGGVAKIREELIRIFPTVFSENEQ